MHTRRMGAIVLIDLEVNVLSCFLYQDVCCPCQNQKSGKCHELPPYKKNRWGGVEVLVSKFKSSGNFTNFRENRYIF